MAYLLFDSITPSIDAWASVDGAGASVELAGSASIATTASAGLLGSRLLAGSVAATATATADATTALRLAGTAAATVLATGNITVPHTFAASALATLSGTADLFTDLHLFNPAAWQAQMRALQSSTTFHPDTLTHL